MHIMLVDVFSELASYNCLPFMFKCIDRPYLLPQFNVVEG